MTKTPKDPKTLDDFTSRVSQVTQLDGYTHPDAFAVGVATVDCGEIVDVRFKTINIGEDNAGSAAIFFGASTQLMKSGGSRIIGDKSVLKKEALGWFDSFKDDGDPHPNIDSLKWVRDCTKVDPGYERAKVGVVAWLPSLEGAAGNTVNAWLLSTMLSRRMILPNSFDLDGYFGALPSVFWTSDGPFVAERQQEIIDQNALWGMPLQSFGVDKFPRMTDYVATADRVRIADASRVRLGAYLSPGTTVMQEGFVNANAGTLGESMVEGRISQGVVVGDGSDIGGGASIMGTLSGGGTHKVSIGKRCLLGANSGIGISLGDDCTVEAGTYVTAGVPVKVDLTNPMWSSVSEVERRMTILYEQTVPAGEGSDIFTTKAMNLSGFDSLLYRRGRSGQIEVLPNTKENALNADLHGGQPALDEASLA